MMKLFAAVVLVSVAACGVDDVEQGHRSIVTEPDAGTFQAAAVSPHEACGQLVPNDDKNCELACTDWLAFASLATVGHCIAAECPLLDGRTFEPGVCLDPRP